MGLDWGGSEVGNRVRLVIRLGWELGEVRNGTRLGME